MVITVANVSFFVKALIISINRLITDTRAIDFYFAEFQTFFFQWSDLDPHLHFNKRLDPEKNYSFGLL